MGRTGFVVQRLLLLIPVAVGVTIIVFFMVHLIPGDPAATILGIHATPKGIALLHQQWGLNRPLASRPSDARRTLRSPESERFPPVPKFL